MMKLCRADLPPPSVAIKFTFILEGFINLHSFHPSLIAMMKSKGNKFLWAFGPIFYIYCGGVLNLDTFHPSLIDMMKS